MTAATRCFESHQDSGPVLPSLVSTTDPGALRQPRNRLIKRFLGLGGGGGIRTLERPVTSNGFRDRRIRPLCHPSGASTRCGAEKEGFEPSREVITPLTP